MSKTGAETTDKQQQNGFKRLGFVSTGGAAMYTEAERLYMKARSYAPSVVGESSLARSVEGFSSQVINTATPIGDKLLHFADNQVDYVVLTATEKIDYTKAVMKDIHEANMKRAAVGVETYKAAGDKFINYISKAGDYVADKLTPASQGVKAARDSLQAAIEKAREATDPDAAVQMAWDAWTTFAAYPAVAKLLDTAEPATQMGLKTFYTVHDALVVMPMYKQAIDLTAMTINFALSTSLYKLGARYLYPMVQPLADVAYNKVTESKVINHLVEYWKPTVVTA